MSWSRSLRRTMALVALGVGAGLVGWKLWQREGAIQPRLPDFVEPGPGPRAPSTRGLGVHVGYSSLLDVQDLIARRGLHCEDTSLRALMQRARENMRREEAERQARGLPTDGLSGASLTRRSQGEENPQVRLSCKEVPSERLGDRERPPSVGRWLFVFDSPAHPLRHVSYRRVHHEPERAFVDFHAAEEAFATLLGQATRSVGEAGPETGDEGGATERAAGPNPSPLSASVGSDARAAEQFPLLQPITRDWIFADLRARVSAVNYGRRGIDVFESLEVPWPVRPDAPRPSAADGAETREPG